MVAVDERRIAATWCVLACAGAAVAGTLVAWRAWGASLLVLAAAAGLSETVVRWARRRVAEDPASVVPARLARAWSAVVLFGVAGLLFGGGELGGAVAAAVAATIVPSVLEAVLPRRRGAPR